jgi:hypothetical protein
MQGSDMILMFLSRGYFTSWNCLREVRHAMMVHTAPTYATDVLTGGRPGAAKDGVDLSALVDEAAERRHAVGVKMSSSIVLVRETDEAMHGGQPIEELVQAAPEWIGCADHVLAFDDKCEACCGFQLNTRELLAKHAYGTSPGTGVVEWRRATAFKLVTLKQIVQHLLLAGAGSRPLRTQTIATIAAPSGGLANTAKTLLHQSECVVYVNGEIDSLPYEMPRANPPRILLLGGCHLSADLQTLLKGAVSGIDLVVVDSSSGSGGPVGASVDEGLSMDDHLRPGSGSDESGAPKTVLVAVVHRGCFCNPHLVSSLRLALRHKTEVVLVHESDTNRSGCEFGEIIGACPAELKGMRGHNDQRLFDPIAVAWTRGAHQPVSVRLLALALGASAGRSGRGVLQGCCAVARSAMAAIRDARAAAAVAAHSPHNFGLHQLHFPALHHGKQAAARAEPRPGADATLNLPLDGWGTFGAPATLSDGPLISQNPMYAAHGKGDRWEDVRKAGGGIAASSRGDATLDLRSNLPHAGQVSVGGSSREIRWDTSFQGSAEDKDRSI